MRPGRFHDHLKGKEGEILLAAFQCIVENGIDATSTHAIARRAGLNQGIIHYYFKSKEALYHDLVEILFNNAASNIEALADSALPPAEKLISFCDFGKSLLGPRQDEWIALNAFFGHVVTVRGDMLDQVQRHSRRMVAALVQVLEEGEAKGDFRTGVGNRAGAIALFMIASVRGLATMSVTDPGGFDHHGPVDLLKQAVRGMVL